MYKLARMPIVELTMLGVALFGMIATGIMAVNTSTYLPDRFSHVKEVALHAYRKRKYRHRLRISLATSPMAFAAFASYFSVNLKRMRARQFLTMTVNNHTFHFIIPETTSNVYLPRTRCLVYLGGPDGGNCDHLIVYYQSDRDYTFIQQAILQPFIDSFKMTSAQK